MRTLLVVAALAVGLAPAASCSKLSDPGSAEASAAPVFAETPNSMGAYEPVGLPPNQKCSDPVRQETGVVLQPASEADRRIFGLSGKATCLWKVGDVQFDHDRTVGVFRAATAEGSESVGGNGLYFSRDNRVFMGSLAIPAAFVKVEGRNVVLEARRGGFAELEWIPVAPDGPPPELSLFSSGGEYLTNDDDRSEVAYERAFREPLGSRRLGPCSTDYSPYSLAEPWVRRLLARQRDFPPSSLDGVHCIWKVGVVTAVGGRRYGVYVHGWEGGASKNHAQHRLILFEDDRRYLGYYEIGGIIGVAIRGSDLIIDSDEPSDPIRIGRAGPPPTTEIEWEPVTFER